MAIAPSSSSQTATGVFLEKGNFAPFYIVKAQGSQENSLCLCQQFGGTDKRAPRLGHTEVEIQW